MSSKQGIVRRVRMLQVKAVTRLCYEVKRVALGRRLLQSLGSVAWAERLLVGYRRGFSTKTEADSCAAEGGSSGHQHIDSIRQHILFGEHARPSDYPVLFHLERLLPEISRIVDVGGNAGNLFYSYNRYLDFPAKLTWTVFDLEASVHVGQELALERGAKGLRFTTDLNGCQPADLVLISGALHFLEAMPSKLLAGWAAMPEHVLINRSPVSEEPSIYGVQDQGTWRTAAKVLNRGELMAAMEGAGYRLVDEWPALELKMKFPLRPQNSVESYSGFLFSRRHLDAR